MSRKHRKIAVLNPNSNAVYTESISNSLDPIRKIYTVTVDCMTLQGAPIAIESDEDIDAVVTPICDLAAYLEADVEGLVIACFADPGLQEARRISSIPVVGSCEAAVLAAIKHGSRLGLISTGDDVVADCDLVHSYNTNIELLEVQSLGIPTAEIPTDSSAVRRMTECGQRLQANGVDAVMLGCAGMATYSDQLGDVLEVPVIECVSAAVHLLIRTIELGGLQRYAPN